MAEENENIHHETPATGAREMPRSYGVNAPATTGTGSHESHQVKQNDRHDGAYGANRPHNFPEYPYRDGYPDEYHADRDDYGGEHHMDRGYPSGTHENAGISEAVRGGKVRALCRRSAYSGCSSCVAIPSSTARATATDGNSSASTAGRPG